MLYRLRPQVCGHVYPHIQVESLGLQSHLDVAVGNLLIQGRKQAGGGAGREPTRNQRAGAIELLDDGTERQAPAVDVRSEGAAERQVVRAGLLLDDSPLVGATFLLPPGKWDLNLSHSVTFGLSLHASTTTSRHHRLR